MAQLTSAPDTLAGGGGASVARARRRSPPRSPKTRRRASATGCRLEAQGRKFSNPRMATLLGTRSKAKQAREEELGGQMSFLDHLDELRSRIIRSLAFVFVVFIGCWFVSDHIYNFLAVPVQRALAEAQRRELPIGGLTGRKPSCPTARLKEDDTGRYVFENTTKLGASMIPPGASVTAKVHKDCQRESQPLHGRGALRGQHSHPERRAAAL